MREWAFVSTHFDDVALSIGGLVWELAKRGDKVEIWTICAGDPPFDKPLSDYAKMLHVFWELGDKEVVYTRSQEDAACCQVLNTSYRRYTIPDCIYRYPPASDEPFIMVPDDIEKPLEPDEAYLIPPVTDFLRKNISPSTELVIPLSIGQHRDHVLVRKAADRLGMPLWHYVDYPYINRAEYDMDEWIPSSAEKLAVTLSPQGIKAWQDGIACHRSQLVFFWANLDEMRVEMEQFATSGGGTTLWKF